MACGCSDNKKLNDNKRLNNNKNLRLEDMKNMSIEEIVGLYKDGYSIDDQEEISNTVDTISPYTYHLKIASMAASPSFNYIEATKGGIGVMTFIALVNNSGSRGMIRLKAFDKTSGACLEDTDMQTDQCIEASFNTYIPDGLFSLAYAMKFSGGQYNTACLRAYVCTSGDACPSSCGTYSTSASATSDNISVTMAANVTPNLVTNLILTPGNGTITATWTEPNNTSIFAYLIALTRVSDNVELARGYVRSNSLNMVNLTNGTQYSLRVIPMSYDFRSGNGVTQTATPVSSASLLTSITIAPISTSIGIGGTRQLFATCRDQNGFTMTCPTITWHTSNITNVTVSPSTGTTTIVTGVATGTSNIIATSGSVTSNISTITVVTTPSQEAGGGIVAMAIVALAVAMMMSKK